MLTCTVEGETVVPPSSIVNLVFNVRYVHPGTTSSSSKADLPNGDAAHEEAGEGEKGEVEKVVEKTLELVSPDTIDKDGKEKEKVWPKNGYAHAPYWPTVRLPLTFIPRFFSLALESEGCGPPSTTVQGTGDYQRTRPLIVANLDKDPVS